MTGGELSVETFEHRYSEAAWVFDEYRAYLPEMPEEDLRDVLRRRVVLLLSRRGLGNGEKFAAPDGSFELTYDGTALVELPADFTEVREQLRIHFGGREGSFGELALGLFPSAWRGWADFAMAPWAGVLVFVRPNPLACVSADNHDWDGTREGARAYYGRLLQEERAGEDANADAPGEGDDYWRIDLGDEWHVDDVKPCTIAGLPAVRMQVFQPADDGTSLLIDRVWVRGPEHIYAVCVWAPEQHEQLVRAVYGALAGFAPAGRPPAGAVGPDGSSSNVAATEELS